jgi:CheY-like chemotaxis protein
MSNGMSVLIVEDNPVSAKLVELMLNANGYKTWTARNGAEALAMLSGHSDVVLVITDYMMPEMNGLELIEKVKGLPGCKDLRFMMTSAYSNRETVTRARELGCVDFLVKPINKTQLIERVTHVLEDVPVVLKDKAQVMRVLDIGSEEYDDLARTFAEQLAVALPLVESDWQRMDDTISGQLRNVLKELAESAAFLGGERFVRLYSRWREEHRTAYSKRPEMLHALRELAAALAPYWRLDPGLRACD